MSVARVQDGVHGLMEFVGMETLVVQILRTAELQRLRRIRQLGLAYFVFPGAEHSRLVHSLGAAHLAIRFAKRLAESGCEFLSDLLVPDETAIRDIAIAALCHDVGHGPLSHVWEREVITNDFNRETWCRSLGIPCDKSTKSLGWHELVGQGLLRWPDGQLHQVLEQQEEGITERLSTMLTDTYYIPYLPMILSNDVDVDRCDYIFRDAHETGVQYGRYDLNWLISTMEIGVTDGDQLVVGFDGQKAPSVLEQFFVARRALYETVYYHKTVQSAEAMVGLLFKRLKIVVRDIGPAAFPQARMFQSYLKALMGEVLGPEDLLRLDDYALWVLIRELRPHSDPTVDDLARRLVERDLFKMVRCKSEVVEHFFDQVDAHDRLKECLRPYCAEPSSYYYHAHEPIKGLNEDPRKSAYFVEFPTRRATRAREDKRLRQLWESPPASHRLFVPREALEDVEILVRGR